jgi:hypothetical protein
LHLRQPNIFTPSPEDGLSEHGGGGGAIAGNVRKSWKRLHDHLRTHVLGGSGSISFATVTPSLVIIGAPNFFSMTALRQSRGNLHCIGKSIPPRKIAWRDASPVKSASPFLVSS